MNAQTQDGAARGVHNHNGHEDPNLGRDDQAALELGFSPPTGLSWRRRRVHQLRESIDRGTYEIDPGRVAEALLARLQGAS